MILAEGDGGMRHSRLGRRLGPGKDVLSALFIRVPEGEIEVDLRGKLGYAEGLLEVIAGAAPECLDRHLLVAVCRGDENENGGLDVLDLFHDVDAGHVGQPVFNDCEIDVAAPFHPLDRNPAGLGRDDSIGVGKTLDIPLEESGIVVNDQYLTRYGVSHGGRTRVASTLPAMLRVMVSRWLVDHCGHAAHPSVQTPVQNGLGDRGPYPGHCFYLCFPLIKRKKKRWELLRATWENFSKVFSPFLQFKVRGSEFRSHFPD